MATLYERVDDNDPDVAQLRIATDLTNDDRIDTLDPLAIVELAEELGISASVFIHIHLKG